MIFWLSISPDAPPSDAGGRLDFLGRPDLFAHAGAYAGLAFFLRLWIGPARLCAPFNVTLRYFMPVLIATVYGVGIELAQRDIGPRLADPLDALADAGGAIMAVAFVGFVVWMRRRRRAAAES